jgi:hypothetical protein
MSVLKGGGGLGYDGLVTSNRAPTTATEHKQDGGCHLGCALGRLCGKDPEPVWRDQALRHVDNSGFRLD